MTEQSQISTSTTHTLSFRCGIPLGRKNSTDCARYRMMIHTRLCSALVYGILQVLILSANDVLGGLERLP
jgi:hypothetical protein